MGEEVEQNNILYELYIFFEWKPEPEFIQRDDNIFPASVTNPSYWLNFFRPERSLVECVSQNYWRQQKWQIALGDEGKVIAVLGDNILEIRTKRADYATIVARTTIVRDANPQWRKLVWSTDCTFLAVAHSNGVVSFYDLTATNLFNISSDCSQPAGLECKDTTHALSSILFVPMRVKDKKWASEVLLIDYKGKLRCYAISQSDGCKLNHSFQFEGGCSAATFSPAHNLLFVAGIPKSTAKGETTSSDYGITAWRFLNDSPFYKLSVASDHPISRSISTNSLWLYLPYSYSKKSSLVQKFVVSPSGNKMVCLHVNGDISFWRLPLFKLIQVWNLQQQPNFDVDNPLQAVHEIKKKPSNLTESEFVPCDINWWNEEAIILSRFNGAVTVCKLIDMSNILGKKPEFLQGAPQVTGSFDNCFLSLECESKIISANQLRRNMDDAEDAEVIKSQDDSSAEEEQSLVNLCTEVVKSALYAITDMERFQPRPKKIRLASRVYRLLGVKSTTPQELYARKIDNGNYAEALALAESYNLDCDLVYQQQWRRSQVCSQAIHNYLAKVSKRIYVVHQCMDRLPKSIAAGQELLTFGLEVTNEEILKEVQGDAFEDITSEEFFSGLTLECLSPHAAELLRCRHLMLFYFDRLKLYEAMIKSERAMFSSKEYQTLRSNTIFRSAKEFAQDGRISALTCLWPHLQVVQMRLSVLENLPESLNPMDYKHLLPMCANENTTEANKVHTDRAADWCEKDIFRSVWSRTWSDDAEADAEASAIAEMSCSGGRVSAWYAGRVRQLEQRTGLVSHALALLRLALDRMAQGLEELEFNLITEDILLYDINSETVTLSQLEKSSCLEVCSYLMSNITEDSFMEHLKQYVMPYLKRYENFTNGTKLSKDGLLEYITHCSVNNLQKPFLVLMSAQYFNLNVMDQLKLCEKCLMAYSGSGEMSMMFDLLQTVSNESDDSVAPSELGRRLQELESLVEAYQIFLQRDIPHTVLAICDLRHNPQQVIVNFRKMARNVAINKTSSSVKEDWESLRSDLVNLQSHIFSCVDLDVCNEIFISALLTSGDSASISMAKEVLDEPGTYFPGAVQMSPSRFAELALSAAHEYFNSASSLDDQALRLAEFCLTKVPEGNPDVDKEMDLLKSLAVLQRFGMNMLPIQVRLRTDRMSLIQEVLDTIPKAYNESFLLLKLGKLLHIEGDDERTREAVILVAIGSAALEAGGEGAEAAGEAARDLLRGSHPRGWKVAARVAAGHEGHPHTLAVQARLQLLNYAALHCPPDHLQEILTNRMILESDLVNGDMTDYYPFNFMPRPDLISEDSVDSTNDDYSDAITSPIQENRSILSLADQDKIAAYSVFSDRNYKKFIAKVSPEIEFPNRPDDEKRMGTKQGIYCGEFYRGLHEGRCNVSNHYYGYKQFSAADSDSVHKLHLAYALLRGRLCHETAEYVNCGADLDNVSLQCAQDMAFTDTAMCVAHLLTLVDGRNTPGFEDKMKDISSIHSVLYYLLLKPNIDVYSDEAYNMPPIQLSNLYLDNQTSPDYSWKEVEDCFKTLISEEEIIQLNNKGYKVDPVHFRSDPDYRASLLFRLTRSATGVVTFCVNLYSRISDIVVIVSLFSPFMFTKLFEIVHCISDIGETDQQSFDLALQIASKSDVKEWIVHLYRAVNTIYNHERIGDADANNIVMDTSSIEIYRKSSADVVKHLMDVDWPLLDGRDHSGVILFFKLLKEVDETHSFRGMKASDHIKLLRKTKSTSKDLDYKLLVSGDSEEVLQSHLLSIARSENVGLLGKLLRTLPNQIRPNLQPSVLYAKWMRKFFFDIHAEEADNKKWMQKYKECSSHFNKLNGKEIVEFTHQICFTQEAIDRVPYQIRRQILLQTVDYFDQDVDTPANEGTMKNCIDQINARALFVHHLYSEPVQSYIRKTGNSHLWKELELWQGDTEKQLNILVSLLREGQQLAELTTVLEDWLPVTTDDILLAVIDNIEKDPTCANVGALVSVVAECPGGAAVRARYDGLASNPALPAIHRAALLHAYQRETLNGQSDASIGRNSLDILQNMWQSPLPMELSEGDFATEEKRRTVFKALFNAATSWHHNNILISLLRYWPAFQQNTSQSELSPAGLVLQRIVTETESSGENIVLIKLLMKHKSIPDNELSTIIETSPPHCLSEKLLLILMSDNPELHSQLPNVINASEHDWDYSACVDDNLVRLVLDKQLLYHFVPTPLYPFMCEHLTACSKGLTFDEAATQLLKRNFLAEAGFLRLNSLGVANTLSTFTASLLIHRKK